MGGGKLTPPPPDPTNCHTLLGEGGGSLFIYLSLSLLYITFSLISLPFFSYVFNGLYLSCHHTLLSLSVAPRLAKVWGMELRGEGAVDK